MKRTKILATYGPSIANPKKISQLVRSGVNAFRVNCSHGKTEDFLAASRIIREGSKNARYPIGLLFDISGPKLRLDQFEGRIAVEKGRKLTIREGKSEANKGILAVNHKGIIKAVKKGERILIDDGSIEFEVIATDRSKQKIVIRALNSGVILPGKGINLPSTNIPLPTISDKDKNDIKTAVRADADFIALSFVRSPDDIREARQLLKKFGGEQKVLVKLEKREAIEKLEPIIKYSDGVMVARGDLGVELPPEEVPRLQKRIVELAASYHKPVIIATQMLESMRFSPRATRAEVNDVATAVFDRVDAVMLSAETATGEYSAEAVRVMSRIIEATEQDLPTFRKQVDRDSLKNRIPLAIAEALLAGNDIAGTKVIYAFTSSGFTAELIANLMPIQPVIAITDDPKVMRRLSLSRSVYPILADQPKSFPELIDAINGVSKKYKLARKKDRVCVTGGVPMGERVPTNMMLIHEVL